MQRRSTTGTQQLARPGRDSKEQLERQIEPLGLEAIRALAPAPGERILDVGCGCGQTSLELASRVTAVGAVIGPDISVPMLEVARARPVSADAAVPDFRQVDAQTGDLGEGVFDAVFSRFGVMFFSDPVAAFTNLRKALKPGGRLAFVCWRPFQENLWMRAPMEAASSSGAAPSALRSMSINLHAQLGESKVMWRPILNG
jgi:ubiquinone/menaquinone biosynthesis C-methylase UbiE